MADLLVMHKPWENLQKLQLSLAHFRQLHKKFLFFKCKFSKPFLCRFEDLWETHIDLPLEYHYAYEFKFLVDGEWTTSSEMVSIHVVENYYKAKQSYITFYLNVLQSNLKHHLQNRAIVT